MNQHRLYRVLELALRAVILGLYEPSNFISDAYNIITKGKVNKTEKSNELIMEEILFGWVKDEENRMDLSSKFNLDKNYKYKNIAIQKKKIDLITALKLLDPEIYSKDLNYFRKSIFEVSNEDLKTFSFEDLDDEYKSYLENVISEDMIKNCWKYDVSIKASATSD